jgi:hypothetical protein
MLAAWLTTVKQLKDFYETTLKKGARNKPLATVYLYWGGRQAGRRGDKSLIGASILGSYSPDSLQPKFETFVLAIAHGLSKSTDEVRGGTWGIGIGSVAVGDQTIPQWYIHLPERGSLVGRYARDVRMFGGALRGEKNAEEARGREAQRVADQLAIATAVALGKGGKLNKVRKAAYNVALKSETERILAESPGLVARLARRRRGR